MNNQRRNIISTTEKGYREAALSVLKNLCFAGEVQEEIQFSCTYPQKSRLLTEKDTVFMSSRGRGHAKIRSMEPGKTPAIPTLLMCRHRGKAAVTVYDTCTQSQFRGNCGVGLCLKKKKPVYKRPLVNH